MKVSMWRAGSLTACLVAGLLATAELALAAVPLTLGVMVVAWRPAASVLAAVAVAMWPTIEVAGIPAGYVAVVVVVVGVAIRDFGRLLRLGWPLVLLIGVAALAVLSHLINPPTLLVTEVEARNHLLATLCGLLLVVVAAVANPERLAALRTVALSGAASSVYLVTSGSVTAGRLSAEELNENGVGHVGALAAVAALSLLVQTRKLWWLAVLIAPLALVVASQSRGAVLIFAVGSFALWAIGRSARMWVLAAGFAPAAVLVIWPLVLGAVELIFSRRNLAYAGTEGRLSALELAAELTLERPLLGIGWRKFPEETSSHLGRAMNTHNEYARLAAESGLISLLAFTVIVIVALRASTGRAVKAMLIAGLTAFALANTMSNLTIAAPVWLALGLAIAARQHSKGQNSDNCALGHANGAPQDREFTRRVSTL